MPTLQPIIVTNLPAERVTELLALVNMLPSNLDGEEILVYLQGFLQAFLPEFDLRCVAVTELTKRLLIEKEVTQ
jgi:hypothetical protein